MATTPSQAELWHLERIIAELLDRFPFGEERYRSALLREVGLESVVFEINLSGPPFSVARDLVNRLASYGALPNRPGYHALGALLSHLLTLDLGRDDAAFIAHLIVEHSLVKDPYLIHRLRERYGPAEQATRGIPEVEEPASDHEPEGEIAEEAECKGIVIGDVGEGAIAAGEGAVAVGGDITGHLIVGDIEGMVAFEEGAAEEVAGEDFIFRSEGTVLDLDEESGQVVGAVEETAVGAELPDWLAELDTEAICEEMAEKAPQEPKAEREPLPPLAAPMADAIAIEETLVGAELPDWLAELGAEAVSEEMAEREPLPQMAPPMAAIAAEELEEEEESRYANVVLVDYDNLRSLGRDYRMKLGDETVLRVDIGPLSPDTLVRRPSEFREDLLPEKPEGHWIDVLVSSTEFELEDGSTASGRLFLPEGKGKARTEDGDAYLYFPMRAPSIAGLAYARIGFYYEGNLLQSYRLVADLGGATPVYADEEPDFMLSETMADVAQLEPRRLSILTNDNADGSHQLVLRGEGTAHKVAATFRLNSGAVGNAVREIRKTLKKIAPTKEERTKKQLIGDMEKLAPLGYNLWTHIMGQIGDQSFELDDLLQEGAYPVVQVARPDTAGYVFPWGLLYDIPIDSSEKLTPCPIIDKLLKDGAAVTAGTRRCPEAVKSGKPHKSNTLCPFGFWGYRYAIEQLSSTKSLVTEIPAPAGNIEMVAALTQYKVDTRMLNEHITRLRGNLDQVVMRVGDTRAEIKEHLHDPDLHLVYFYCHGNYPDQTGGDTYLGIGNRETLTGPDFESWRTEWWRQERIKVWDKIRPLIFINACHSVDIEPDSLVSLLKSFVGRAGAAGVIGTEVRVNQPLAVKVAEIFFDEFVNKGTAVSQALHKIQLHFLNKGNLFGLMYTPYCSADLKLGRN